uniref:Acetylglutamate kinase n=1 Tax=Harveyella mirabilis TaxID=282355 RepID=A0A3S8UW68_9FLOR|nr:acetylglutamate kinase [Harveyella mirabilis]
MSNNTASDRFYFSSKTLSFVNQYIGSTFVIKYGGSVMQNDSLQIEVIKDIALLYLLGIKIVLVHGGGLFINDWLYKLNIQPKFQNGVRVTDPDTMEIVEMVLAGKINKSIVSLFNQNNILSLGISGKDANLIKASSLSNLSSNLTGKIESINTLVLELLLSNKFLPVIASVASDSDGNTYNINADTAASSIASALKANKLILLTDTPGILYDVRDPSSLIHHLNFSVIKELYSKNLILDGMIPKVESCISALNGNVKTTHIIDGREKHSLLYEVLTDKRVGSMITL